MHNPYSLTVLLSVLNGLFASSVYKNCEQYNLRAIYTVCERPYYKLPSCYRCLGSPLYQRQKVGRFLAYIVPRLHWYLVVYAFPFWRDVTTQPLRVQVCACVYYTQIVYVRQSVDYDNSNIIFVADMFSRYTADNN